MRYTEYLHEQNIIINQLTTENILVTDSTPLILSFDCSVSLEELEFMEIRSISKDMLIKEVQM